MMLPVERGSGEQKSNLLCAAGELGGKVRAAAEPLTLSNAQNFCLRAHRCCCFQLGEGGGCRGVCVWVCVCMCVFIGRAGAYLMTAAALAAFSSACCCKSFHLTFHAENKIADEPRRNRCNQIKSQPAACPRLFGLLLKSVDPRRGWKSLYYFFLNRRGSGALGSVAADHLKISVPAGEKEINDGSFKAKGARPLTSAEHTNSSQLGSP